MNLTFKNINITEKYLFYLVSTAMILTLLFQLCLMFFARVEVNFKPLFLTSSMLLVWFYLHKKESPDKSN